MPGNFYIAQTVKDCFINELPDSTSDNKLYLRQVGCQFLAYKLTSLNIGAKITSQKDSGPLIFQAKFLPDPFLFLLLHGFDLFSKGAVRNHFHLLKWDVIESIK